MCPSGCRKGDPKTKVLGKKHIYKTIYTIVCTKSSSTKPSTQLFEQKSIYKTIYTMVYKKVHLQNHLDDCVQIISVRPVVWVHLQILAVTNSESRSSCTQSTRLTRHREVKNRPSRRKMHQKHLQNY